MKKFYSILFSILSLIVLGVHGAPVNDELDHVRTEATLHTDTGSSNPITSPSNNKTTLNDLPDELISSIQRKAANPTTCVVNKKFGVCFPDFSLLEKSDIYLKTHKFVNAGDALINAVKNNRTDIVGILCVRDDLTEEDIKDALLEAIRKKYKKIVEIILRVAKDKLSLENLGSAFVIAIDLGLFRIVKMFLKLVGKKISPEHYGKALIVAANVGNKKLVEFILKKEGSRISTEHLIEARLNAQFIGSLQVAAIIYEEEKDRNLPASCCLM